MVFLIITIILVFLLIRFFRKHAFPPMGCVSLVTGAVKSGKSTYAVWRCVSMHFCRMVGAYVYNFFHRKKKREIPMLYSNVPLRYKWYRQLTRDLLLRKERFYYGSVVYVNEASLLADSKMFKDEELNEFLLLFNKLFGHETYGGFLLYDTQSLSDCHYAIKRCIAEYIHLDGKKKVPFGMLVSYRRMKMTTSEDSIDVNVFDGKEDERPSVFLPSLTWKIFDAFCYSILTDDLPISDIKGEKDCNLKARSILTFKPSRFKNMRKNEPKKVIKKGDNKDYEVPKILDI